MMFEDAMMAAQDVVTQIEQDPTGKPVRLEVNADNKTLIAELVSMCNALPYLGYRVLGQVGRKNGFFEIYAKIERPGGEVIVVDFQKKCVVSRQAA